MKTNRLIGFLFGGLAFIVAQLIEVRMWATWFDGNAHQAWFMNDQHAAQFMLCWMFVTSLIAGWFRLPGPMVSLGACVAMSVILFTMPGGPGTIFPIVVVVGGVLLIIACWPAAFIGKELRGLVTRRHATP